MICRLEFNWKKSSCPRGRPKAGWGISVKKILWCRYAIVYVYFCIFFGLNSQLIPGSFFVTVTGKTCKYFIQWKSTEKVHYGLKFLNMFSYTIVINLDQIFGKPNFKLFQILVHIRKLNKTLNLWLKYKIFKFCLQSGISVWDVGGTWKMEKITTVNNRILLYLHIHAINSPFLSTIMIF